MRRLGLGSSHRPNRITKLDSALVWPWLHPNQIAADLIAMTVDGLIEHLCPSGKPDQVAIQAVGQVVAIEPVA